MAMHKSFVANFKKQKNKQVARPAVSVSYMAIEESDIKDLDASQVVKVLNDRITAYGKQLIAEHGDDWTYIPEINDLTFDKFYADFSAPSARGNRILSKEKLTALGVAYELHAVEKLGKSEQSAATGAQLIVSKFSSVSGNQAVLNAMAMNIAEMEVEDNLTAAFEALMEILTELLSNELSVDAL